MIIRHRGPFTKYSLAAALLLCFTVACSGQTEDQALASLRQMTRDGKLPPEPAVVAIESRFAGKTTGALAKLLRARIHFENGDPAGAAAMLDSTVFAEKTKVGDYALWLRGKALQNSGSHAEAIKVLTTLIDTYPTSLRRTDAELLRASSAIASGSAAQVPEWLSGLNSRNNSDSLLLTAKGFDAKGDTANAITFYRKAYFFGAGSPAAKEAEAKLTAASQPLAPASAEELGARVDRLYAAKNWTDAANAQAEFASRYPQSVTPLFNLRRIVTLGYLKRMPDALAAFDAIPASAPERQEAYYQLVMGYARSRQWPAVRSRVDEMRQKFPAGKWTPKAYVDAGLSAREAKNTVEESYLLSTAVGAFPDAIEVAQAQFEFAWTNHEKRDFERSSQMFIEHLAKYVDRDTTNRGKAGYWAARDSERAGRVGDACILYTALAYRYGANWYGHLANQRLASLKGKCSEGPLAPLPGIGVTKAAANLKLVTVAAETAGAAERELAAKGDQLSIIGLFDWAIDELNEAKKTAENSPSINLALARHYRLKGDQVNALLSLAKSYPDYAQMFPEEMGREEWDIFYPLTNWSDIKTWASRRNLDAFQVAGFIRQETIFDPRARSSANAYGLMQLLLPTARTVAKKYGTTVPSSGEDLYQPALNIELGTAYLRDQFDKFGRVEYVAVAYNAGPGRVPQWRATLPLEIDEFVEEIPFKETKGYVQGIIRNSAQYRRLYDENGNFRSNVGTRPLRGEIDSKPRDQLAAEFPEVVIDDGKAE
jgi:soluble lytic murein transglycosylase